MSSRNDKFLPAKKQSKDDIISYISNIYNREEFRKKSLISDVVNGGIFGLGSNGYILAIMAIHKILLLSLIHI